MCNLFCVATELGNSIPKPGSRSLPVGHMNDMHIFYTAISSDGGDGFGQKEVNARLSDFIMFANSLIHF